MVLYRKFLLALREITFEEVHILLHEDVSAKIKQYIFLLNSVRFTDGEYYSLYGNIKRAISSFVMFFTETIDYVIREADKYSHIATRTELIRLMERTIAIHETSQAEFLDEYLPATHTTPLELEILNDIEKKYQAFMNKALAFKDNLNRMDRPEKVDEFAKQHFKIAIRQMNKVLNFCHGYLGRMLVDRVDQIQISLEEIQLRLRNNLKKIYEDNENIMYKLRHELYDKNKKCLTLSRSYNKNALETAEVNKSIDIIRNKIETYEGLPVTARLEEEVDYWNKKVAEASEIKTFIDQLKKERKEIIKQKEIYNNLTTTELPGTKKQCFGNMGENYNKMKIYLDEKMVEISKAMITLFCCTGTESIYYTDNIGLFHMDDFSHQVYIKDHLKEVYHVNCDGDFVNVHEEAYYFDEFGRYIIDENGEKTYRCAPCTNQYRIMESGLRGKITKDCGHSERKNSKCRMEMQDSTKVLPILPMTEPVNIRKTLDNEAVKYLWDSFGAILPSALNDVGTMHSKNPIHHLAHMLLTYNHTKTRLQLRNQQTEAQKYRADILKRDKERAIAASKAWKAKQVQRRKPEESDDTMDWHVYDQRMAQHEFINSLDHYN